VYGREHPADVELPRTYDLIWCGSLLTHLDAPMWEEFFDFFERALAPGGLLVASLQSRYWLPRKLLNSELAEWVLPSRASREKIASDYERVGFGFAEYPMPPESRAEQSVPTSYGISLVKQSWLWGFLEQRPLECVGYMEGRWGDQDVLCLVKRA
jgi:SAM-dependent methyltransferase